jgi:hypothetical protein
VWNALIAEGLVANGQRELAAELVARLMEAIAQNLGVNGSFWQHYHARTGQGLGERDMLLGLPPLGLFLEVLGVRLISPWEVMLEGSNPFPWEVKIKYRGLTVERGLEKTHVTFPDGQTLVVEETTPCLVIGREDGKS